MLSYAHLTALSISQGKKLVGYFVKSTVTVDCLLRSPGATLQHSENRIRCS